MSNSLWRQECNSLQNSPDQNTGVGRLFLLQGLNNPGIETRSHAIQADSLQAESQGKPVKNYEYEP